MKKIFSVLLLLLIGFVSMAQSVDGSLKTLTATGTNTYVITEPLPATYDPKERFLVRFTNANSGAATLNRATLGAKALQNAGAVPLVSGDIKAGETKLLSYNGTYYQIVGGGAVAAASSSTAGITKLYTATGSNTDGAMDQNSTTVALGTKQATLVSGTNIKTVDGVSILGSGDISSGGTVTTVSVTTANGVSGSVATATTTPAITLTLGAITPTSVNSVIFSGSSTPTLAVSGTSTISGTHSGTSSGTNTGDQTSVTGNAGTATALQTARTINGTSFDGTSNITVAAAASTLTGSTLASGVTASSLTSFGTNPVVGTQSAGNNSTRAASTAYADALVAESITNGVTGIAPSEDVVFDTFTGKQPLDADLTTVAGLSPTNDDIMQYKSGAWANRTISQVKTDLSLVSDPGTVIGQLPYLSATSPNVYSALSDIATGNVLLSGGVGAAPSYGKVALTTHVSGVLPIANMATGTPDGTKFVRDDGTLAVPAGGSGWATTGTTTLTGASVIAGTTTNTLKFNFDALGTTLTNGAGIWNYNSTAAASGLQQISPLIVQEGQGWKTNATAATQSVKIAQYTLPIQGAANPTSSYVFAESINGGAYSTIFAIGSGGSISTNTIGNISGTMTVGTTTSASTILRSNNSNRLAIDNVGNIVYTATAQGSGGHIMSTWTPAAHTAQTASTNIPLLYINSNGATRTFAAGAKTEQNEILITAPIWAAASATTTTDAYTLNVPQPTASTNMTFTNSGSAHFTGNTRTDGKALYDATITAGGTTGNQTINKPSGTVNIAAAGTTVTVTNSYCTTSSIVLAVIRTNDATARISNVVPGSGSFVINIVACTAEVSIGFIVYN